MKFRVTSITGDEEASALRSVAVEIQDQLNAALSDKNFGANLDQVTIIVVTAFDEIEENEKWAAPHNKLGHVASELTGERIRYLSFGVAIHRKAVLDASLLQLRERITLEIMKALSIRPKRLAAGLDYAALTAALQSVLRGASRSAA